MIVMKMVSKDYRVLNSNDDHAIGAGDWKDRLGSGDGGLTACFKHAVKISFVSGRIFDCLSLNGTGTQKTALTHRSAGSEARLPVSYDDFQEVRTDYL